MSEKVQKLIQLACESGASGVAVIAAGDIVVEPGLADKCREPRCENYGLSKSCPPHVGGPAEFKRRLKTFHQAIFFKIDVPSEILFSSENRKVFQLLHETASGIERHAVKLGFADAQAYAGGSCKKIFCYDHTECLALSEAGTCRHPEHARPSMSGFGVKVAHLYEKAGWSMGGMTQKGDSGPTELASVCGLVFIY